MPSRGRERAKDSGATYMRCNKEDVWRLKMRIFLALAIAVTVIAGGAYSVVRSLNHPVAEGTYEAYTSGAASRIDLSDRINAGYYE
jgi:hypothetical protein